MALTSYCQGLLQGAAAQNIAWKHIRKDFSQFASGFRRSI